VAPTRTARSRERVAYLEALRADVEAIVRDYLEQRPDAEDVTVEVLERIGPERLVQVSGSRDLKRLAQDMGLLVALTLVDAFGPDRVLTLRGPDGKAVSPRRNAREGLFVTRYTPHRVLPEGHQRRDRILLDAGAVRAVLYADTDALDLEALALLHGERPVSIADGALAELALALLEGQLSLEAWAAGIARFDTVLDPTAPVFPGGLELATLAGLHSPPPAFDAAAAFEYYRQSWALLRRARTKEDLERPSAYVDASGRRWQLRLDSTHVRGLVAEAGMKWRDWIDDIGRQMRDLRREGDRLGAEDLRELIRSVMSRDMTAGALDKLDLAIRVIAERTLQAASGYAPQTHNDSLDFDLLFAVALPATICTTDARLVRLVRRTGAADADRVLFPSELLAKLAGTTPPALPGDASAGLSPRRPLTPAEAQARLDELATRLGGDPNFSALNDLLGGRR